MFVHNCYCLTKYFISFESSPSEPFLQNCNWLSQYFRKSDLPGGWSVVLALCGSYSFSPAFHSQPPYPPESDMIFCKIVSFLKVEKTLGVLSPLFYIYKLLVCFFKTVMLFIAPKGVKSQINYLFILRKFKIFIMTLTWWAGEWRHGILAPPFL